MSQTQPPHRRRLAVLGSTGSIGRQTLDVVRAYPEHFEITALAAHSNVALLAEQAQASGARALAITAEDAETERLRRGLLPHALSGEAGLSQLVTREDVDIVVAATSGVVALRPTLMAIEAGKTIALANKETLVMAGHLVTAAAQRAGVEIRPVDSEHNAIWQCLRGESLASVRRLLVTASGGPMRGMSAEQMRAVTPQQALAHPTWHMGTKITIDSATLMNKGLEVIEAHWLFDVPFERIAVVVQPQSIIHSMVEFVDDSIKAQASIPSMHLPIQDALSYPERLPRSGTALAQPLSWPSIGHLDFEDVDLERFPCLRLAYEAGRRGGTAPSVLVGADEEVVPLFLTGAIGFADISRILGAVLSAHDVRDDPDLDAVIEAARWARDEVARVVQSGLVGQSVTSIPTEAARGAE